MKKYLSFSSLLLLILLCPACGKKDTDATIPEEELPSSGITNLGNEKEGPNGIPESITSPAGPSEAAPETQGSLPATQGNHSAEDIPDEEQEVGRKGGKMLPIEWIDPAEYANFAKECQDYSPGDEQRGNVKDYALDGNLLYVRSYRGGDPLIYCLDLETEDCYPL